MPFSPEVFSYDDLRREAEEFLSEYHPSLSIPTPIEEVVEFDLGDDYRWFEFQANSFAGLVLVPPASLKARFERLVGEAEAGGLRRSRLFEHPQRQRLIEKLASNFQVSEQTVEIRLEKDALVPAPPTPPGPGGCPSAPGPSAPSPPSAPIPAPPRAGRR